MTDPNRPYRSWQGIESPEEAYRRWEGPDHPMNDPWAATPRSLMLRFGALCGIGGLFIGLLTMAIFVTH